MSGDRAVANDLVAGADGTERVGTRRRKPSSSDASGAKKRKKKKEERLVNELGDEWLEDEEFECLLIGKKVSIGVALDGQQKGTVMYRCQWIGWSDETSTWEPHWNISDDLIDEYEAALDAETQLDAEEDADDDCDD